MFFDYNYDERLDIQNVTLCIISRGYWLKDVYNTISCLRHIFNHIIVASFRYNKRLYELCHKWATECLFGIEDENLSDLYNMVMENVATDWALIISDDELPSVSFLKDLEREIIPLMLTNNISVGKINYKQSLDGIITNSDFYAEKLFRKQRGSSFTGKTHIIYDTSLLRTYFDTKYYMIHFKSVNKLLWGLVWASLLYPEGHHSKAMNELKTYLNINGLRDIKNKILSGFDADTEEYMLSLYHKDVCIKALVWLYFFVLHREKMQIAIEYHNDYLEFVLDAYGGKTLCLEI